MEEVSVSSTESESESEWDPKSSTESDSQRENNRKRKNKGKKRKKTKKQSVSRKYSKQIIEHQTELHVTCGNKKGLLNVEKYNDMQECIFSEGRWFTPSEFEKFGGKQRSKKWKYSIRCEGFPLQNLLVDVIQTGRDGARMVQNETIFPESWKRLFSKTLAIRLCRNEGEILRKETIQSDSSSDESVTVAKRVKKTRRESVIGTVSKMTTQQVEPTDNNEDSPEQPTDAPKPAISPVIEEADDEDEAPLSFNSPPAECQNSVDSEEPPGTSQRQLFEFLAKQFNSINDTLKSMDASLKKLAEKQLHGTMPQYNQMCLRCLEK